jgi:hypothetical protein
MPSRPAIPVIDVRAGGPVALAAERLADLDELRSYCLAYLPAAVRPFVPLADTIARRWLARTASPYKAEIAEIAAIARAPGVYLVNTSYEWGCTAAMCHGGGAPLLLRTLDWPFAGLGRKVVVARQKGPAGEFWNVTWPGAVGVLTAVAPGRFAATINQAPLFRRTRGEFMRYADFAVNALGTLSSRNVVPPDHALREVFETAVDFADARAKLARVPMARPVLIALAGLRPQESCVIEREESDARIVDGAVVVANDWQEPRRGWEPRSCGGPHATDSRDRRAALAERRTEIAQPFAWVEPPVRNWATRLAVEMSAGDGCLRVVGYEPTDGIRPAEPATAMFDLAQQRVAA